MEEDEKFKGIRLFLAKIPGEKGGEQSEAMRK